MINPNTLNPDFSYTEHLDQKGDFHLLSIHHISDRSYANFEAYKWPSDHRPKFSYSWETAYDAAKALTLFEHVGSIAKLKIEKGTLYVLDSHSEQDATYDWLAETVPIPPNEQTYSVDEVISEGTSVMRLNTKKATFVWALLGRPNLGIVTHDRLDTDWVKMLMGRTIEPSTRPLVDRALGRISFALEQFVNTPFGEPILSSPNSSDISFK